MSFIGCPLSGKTTTAAQVFASLKEQGITAEFVAERARYYIAHKRMSSSAPVKLTDQDQIGILTSQYEHEAAFASSVGESGVVVSDAAPVLALLYMTPEFVEKLPEQPSLAGMVKKSVEQMNLVFHCMPVRDAVVWSDKNRIHSLEQALAIHERIPELLSKYAPKLSPIILEGTAVERTQQALSSVYRALLTYSG